MKLRVLSVKEKTRDEPLSFSAVDETGRAWPCFLGVRVRQEDPDIRIEPGDELIVDDFVPDLITDQIGPVLIPQFVRKVAGSK